jgi:hypothetical protein
MPEIRQPDAIVSSAQSVREDIAAVCALVPPCWDLPNFVAVNPFLGFAADPVDLAARRIADGLGGDVLPPVFHARWRMSSGEFDARDVRASAARHGLDPARLEEIAAGGVDPPTRSRVPMITFAERHDRLFGSDWHGTCIRSLARWCAVYATRGGASWRVPAGRPLFASWIEAAAHDRSFDLHGLRGFRTGVTALPAEPTEAIVRMLEGLDVTERERRAYLYRLLGGLYGWAAHFRRIAWERDRSDVGMVRDVLAMRVCVDAAVARLAPGAGRGERYFAAVPVEDETVRLALLEANEDGVARRYLRRLGPAPQPPGPRPAVQAVFCIDVRSEVIRRHLESRSDLVETRGFAGFFGVPFRWDDAESGSGRCPVLLDPGFVLSSPAGGCSGGDPAARALGALHAAPAGAFAFMETVGLSFAARLGLDAAAAMGLRASKEEAVPLDLAPSGSCGGIAPASRLEIAQGMLRGMGFGATFARLVLLCGHAGRSANNPHAASLDCGACGGHGGALNARVAAMILNDPEVRRGLHERGIQVPADTHFLACVHDTSTDDVRFLDEERVPGALRQELEDLRAHLQAASQATREERAAALGLGPSAGDGSRSGLRATLGRRSRDWSEVRPEWALARNAFFLVARRSRSRGADLEGRAFLHEYDPGLDADGAVLRQILAAPVVVASWINLQYLASTVDNDRFGAGDKTLHNRVGSVGVVLGNGGDLRTGLPLQSVQQADGRWRHEPLRLQVIVEAPRDRVTAALGALPAVSELVDNGWVRLLRLEPSGAAVERYVPGHGWQPV